MKSLRVESRLSKRRKDLQQKQPLWMISFCDLMFLTLTFFIGLVIISNFDERSSLMVLDSISGTFGTSEPFRGALTPRPLLPGLTMVELGRPGHSMHSGINPERLENILLEDAKDITVRENQNIIVLSLDDDLLFEPGSIAISADGKRRMDRLVPYMQNMNYPMLIAGHTAPYIDEAETTILPSGLELSANPTWRLSLQRATEVYRHYLSRGVDSKLMQIEAFGEFYPAFANNTPEGRQKNRRVDIVIDKRNRYSNKLLNNPNEGILPGIEEYYYKEFKFDLRNLFEEPEEQSLFINLRGLYHASIS